MLTIIVLPAIFIFLMAGLFTENISPYISVTELKSEDMVNRNVQVFGDVVVNTIKFDKDTSIQTFDITDGSNSVEVNHRGVVNNLQNATEVVAIGKYIDGVFQADQVLVKCPSKYQEEESKED
jgi:cytochrome c-type biogenesis protein CcmE